MNSQGSCWQRLSRAKKIALTVAGLPLWLLCLGAWLDLIKIALFVLCHAIRWLF